MDNIKNDEYYISKIKENLNFIVKHMENTEWRLKMKRLSEGFWDMLIPMQRKTFSLFQKSS